VRDNSENLPESIGTSWKAAIIQPADACQNRGVFLPRFCIIHALELMRNVGSTIRKEKELVESGLISNSIWESASFASWHGCLCPPVPVVGYVRSPSKEV
jgi:hypothetical protein